MRSKLYRFKLIPAGGKEATTFYAICVSRKVAWLNAAGYVACHTLNPPVVAISYDTEFKIVDTPIDNDEVTMLRALELVWLAQ